MARVFRKKQDEFLETDGPQSPRLNAEAKARIQAQLAAENKEDA